MPQRPAATGRQLVAALKNLALEVLRIENSHHILRDPDGRRTVVPVHCGEDLGPGLMSNVLGETHLTQDDVKPVDRRQEEIGFSPRRFSALMEISATHFWFAGRQALIRRILDRRIPGKVERLLDVGCGPGVWLPSWCRYARDVCGIDPFAAKVKPEALADGTRLVTGVASQLPVADGQTDLILALDVLEHVDDRPALQEMKRALRPGGQVLITVPACPWVWSHRDDDAGHLRRYTSRALREVIEQAGFEIGHLQYYQSLLFPLTVLSRVLGRQSSRLRDAEDHPPEWLNRTLRRINLFEVEAGLRLPFGSSLIAVARKPS